jgi:hypothetical protein
MSAAETRIAHAAVVSRFDYDCIGSGAYLGHFFVRPVFNRNKTVRETILLGTQTLTSRNPISSNRTSSLFVWPSGKRNTGSGVLLWPSKWRSSAAGSLDKTAIQPEEHSVADEVVSVAPERADPVSQH